MSLYGILTDRLRAVERLYDDAAGVFIERKRRIEAGEEPYQPPPFNPDIDALEPPFLAEWLEANEFQNVIGQACLSLVQSCLKDYLDGIFRRSGITAQADWFLSDRRNRVKGESWFGRYLALFTDAYHIKWNESPVSTQDIEEINIARNDMQHGKPALGLNRYQTKQHGQRFPLGLFTDDVEKGLRKDGFLQNFALIYVSPEALKESISRVKTFCEFVENRTR